MRSFEQRNTHLHLHKTHVHLPVGDDSLNRL